MENTEVMNEVMENVVNDVVEPNQPGIGSRVCGGGLIIVGIAGLTYIGYKIAKTIIKKRDDKRRTSPVIDLDEYNEECDSEGSVEV